jgi:hypothetical protein
VAGYKISSPIHDAGCRSVGSHKHTHTHTHTHTYMHAHAQAHKDTCSQVLGPFTLTPLGDRERTWSQVKCCHHLPASPWAPLALPTGQLCSAGF